MGQSRIRVLIISLALAGTSTMCSLLSPSQLPTPLPDKKQATISSLQLTVKAIEKSVVTTAPEPTKVQPFPTMDKPATGSISGKISYPSDPLPHIKVVALNTATHEAFSTDVFIDAEYVLNNVPIGRYHVMAYLVGSANSTPLQVGGYSQAVTCEMGADCTDHTLVDVDVMDGGNCTDVNPVDWSAPPGTYPPDPLN
jgi:hypothetical protein